MIFNKKKTKPKCICGKWMHYGQEWCKKCLRARKKRERYEDKRHYAEIKEKERETRNYQDHRNDLGNENFCYSCQRRKPCYLFLRGRMGICAECEKKFSLRTLRKRVF